MNLLIDVAYGIGAGAVVLLVYSVWLVTFGTAKYRRWAKEGKEPSV